MEPASIYDSVGCVLDPNSGDELKHPLIKEWMAGVSSGKTSHGGRALSVPSTFSYPGPTSNPNMHLGTHFLTFYQIYLHGRSASVAARFSSGHDPLVGCDPPAEDQ